MESELPFNCWKRKHAISKENAKNSGLGVRRPGSHLGVIINSLCDLGKDTSPFLALVPSSESTGLLADDHQTLIDFWDFK